MFPFYITKYYFFKWLLKEVADRITNSLRISSTQDILSVIYILNHTRYNVRTYIIYKFDASIFLYSYLKQFCQKTDLSID